ncbi:Murein DD-endopeptidase MepM and murein hydrolase activator NlpD, contain LysM domain [Zunongwangia mangrovi]|uniref:Murein DD-endopeptidase MepM and murein hydrolase activator NlpD, contain LysM domain n=1 Tax=Zunongwangia mangrovi TaxID=1334022 RepID=A0A1I1E4B0_9FLAO|nr:M23 family metallopeptidase [Zunongwangia mangrovi]SFB81917.1 Murein DD-endopeptidase MepM and murein hydrolase activator NlpD, contain LysM domain [Zunongwangia mangrovi]
MKQYLFYIFLALIFASCSRLNKATDFITNPTAKEVYKRDFNISDELYSLWEQQHETGLQDSLKIELPFAENGHFLPKSFPIYAYEMNLNIGEIFNFEIFTDSINDLVFIDFYRITGDSIKSFDKIESAEIDQKIFQYEIKESGDYKIVIQPAIETQTDFVLKFDKKPAYFFPVAGGQNSNIQSYWGATRDGGARSHEGIDIFAKRGTPVLAATNGRIGFTGEKGLGGKQVWLRDTKRGQSLYYAHLDSIAKTSGSVKTGDTLGFVGNTGNARTTPPHLHFGIYKHGAINPLHFVKQAEEFKPEISKFDKKSTNLITKSSIANLRDKPTTSRSQILGQAKNKDTLQLLGKTGDWYHVRPKNKSASFIHESLVAPM